MSDADDLMAIANEISNLEPKVYQTLTGRVLARSEDDRRFRALVVEATAIIKERLGPANDFTFAIADATRKYKIADIEQQIRAAVRHIRRKERNGGPSQAPFSLPGPVPHPVPYVSPSRIAEIETLKGKNLDFSKLAQLCKELNIAHANECHYATAILVRVIADHVPPVFGHRTFAQVASNYPGTKSFKKSMLHLEGSLRNIADGMIHEPLRPRESLPTAQQVDFRQDLDLLLSELVRIA